MSRFLLIGLDGAEPTLLERWTDEGYLPHLASLRNRGSYLHCDSTVPPATFPAWTTCVTGVNPGRHGIFDFTEVIPGRYAIRFVNATFRKAPAVWSILSAAGKRVGILGVPATYPPETVNGFMVSGFDSPVATCIDRSFVHPPDLYEEVRGWRFADFQETRIGPGWHAAALPRLLDSIAKKEAIARKLFRQEPWDFFMVVFGEADTAGHHFWLFQDDHSPRHQPGFPDAILQVYARLDKAVGGFLEEVGDDVLVGVVSDHGFGGSGTGVLHLNNWLAERDYLNFRAGFGSFAKRLGVAVTPAQWQGVLFRRLSNLAARAESRSRFHGIDWTQTRAWSEELNYFPSIRVNLRGREPQGQVNPPDYEAFCRDLSAELEGWWPVRKAWRRDELYHGPYVDRAPDIILELALEEGYSHSCLRSRGGPAFRRLLPHEYLGGKERGTAGAHRATGVLFLSTPAETDRARLEDVAPMVLAHMGVTGPPMDGRSLLGRPQSSAQATQPFEERPYSPHQAHLIEDRLRSLGYFE